MFGGVSVWCLASLARRLRPKEHTRLPEHIKLDTSSQIFNKLRWAQSLMQLQELIQAKP